MKKRYNNYDLLRLISCISVIIIHVSAMYKNAITNQTMDVNYKININQVTSILTWNTLSRFAVPCFVMLSGAFLLSNNKNQEYKEFYKKSFKKIVLPIIVFSILFFLYNIAISVAMIIFKNKELTILLKPIKEFFMGNAYYHLWYLYMIMFLYLLVPIIIRLKNSISQKMFSIVAWIFLIFASLSAWTTTFRLSWDIGNAFEYLGFFLVGYEIKQKYEKNTNNKKGLVFICLGILIEAMIIPIQYNHTMKGISEAEEIYSLIGNFNPLIVIASILIFIGFSNITIKRELIKISDLTFYIYIFHAVIWDFVSKAGKLIGVIDESANANIVILCGTMIVFILSYITSIIWIKIKNTINKNNRIYNTIDKIFENI